MTRDMLVTLFLKLSLATVFVYAAIASFLDPTGWIGFFPLFMRNLLPGSTILTVFSVYQILLALWILSGWKTFYPSLLAALTISGIIIFNLGALEIVFRDIAIIFAALALAAWSYKK